MLDEQTLQPVIIAMALYIATVVILPKIIKKPTGIGFVDEIVMHVVAQQGAITPGAILIGLIVLATNYIKDEYI